MPVPQSAPQYSVGGWLEVVGGIGPHFIGSASGNYQVNYNNGEVVLYWDKSFSEIPLSNRFTVTDARGASVFVDMTLATTTNPVACANWRTPIQNANPNAYSDYFPDLTSATTRRSRLLTGRRTRRQRSGDWNMATIVGLRGTTTR